MPSQTPAYVESVGAGSRKRSIAGVLTGPSLFEKKSWETLSGALGGTGATLGAPAALGLSKAQALTRVYRGGFRLVLPRVSHGGGGKVGGRRQACRGMSRHAAKTARRWFNSIDSSKVTTAWFSGMTIPAQERMSIKEFKKVLERYFACLQRAFGDRLFWYWAIEPHADGRPHVHVVFFWVSRAPTLWAFRKWNDLTWARSTRCQHPSHLKAACSVNKLRSWTGARSYLMDYLSVDKWAAWDGSETGGVHGVRNRQLVPVTVEDVDLDPLGQKLARRLVAKIRGRRGRGVWLCPENGKRVALHRGQLPVDPNEARAYIKRLRAAGATVKCSKGRTHRNELHREWADEFKDGRYLGLVFCGEYIWAQGPSELYCREAENWRVIDWARREAARREETNMHLPF